jgi:hypothetical protein
MQFLLSIVPFQPGYMLQMWRSTWFVKKKRLLSRLVVPYKSLNWSLSSLILSFKCWYIYTEVRFHELMLWLRDFCVAPWIEFMVKGGGSVNWFYGEGRCSVICFGWWCWRRGEGYGDRGVHGAEGWGRRRLVWRVVRWTVSCIKHFPAILIYAHKG